MLSIRTYRTVVEMKCGEWASIVSVLSIVVLDVIDRLRSPQTANGQRLLLCSIHR